MNASPSVPRTVIGLDVETANPQGAICEFAAVAIDGLSGAQIFTVASLVDPGHVPWSTITTRIHGISRDAVRGKPTIAEVWEDFCTQLSEVDDARLFAHNAAMDRSWIEKSLGRPPHPHIECTINLAKRVPTMHGYSLSAVCASLGIPFLATHRATADALAAARVARHLLLGIRGSATRAVRGHRSHQEGVAQRRAPRGWTRNETRGRNHDIIATTTRIDDRLTGSVVCITGQFRCGWTRKQGKERIVAHGGVPRDDISGNCNLLVMAGKSDPLGESDFSSEKARKARSRGIRVISEAELLSMLAPTNG